MRSDVDKILSALADPVRRTIVEELADRNDQTLYELCVRMIMKHNIDITRQGVSKHLAILEGAGLVRTWRQGKYKLLSLDERPIRDLSVDWIDRIIRKGR